MSTLKEDLVELRRLKKVAGEAKRAKDEADNEFKQHQLHCVERMEAEGIESMRTDGTLFSLPEEPTVYGQIQDRSAFVEWAKENEPELVEYKERKALLNALVRQRLDDDQELPPGVTFRPDRPISQRNS